MQNERKRSRRRRDATRWHSKPTHKHISHLAFAIVKFHDGDKILTQFNPFLFVFVSLLLYFFFLAIVEVVLVFPLSSDTSFALPLRFNMFFIFFNFCFSSFWFVFSFFFLSFFFAFETLVDWTRSEKSAAAEQNHMESKWKIAFRSFFITFWSKANEIYLLACQPRFLQFFFICFFFCWIISLCFSILFLFGTNEINRKTSREKENENGTRLFIVVRLRFCRIHFELNEAKGIEKNENEIGRKPTERENKLNVYLISMRNSSCRCQRDERSKNVGRDLWKSPSVDVLSWKIESKNVREKTTRKQQNQRKTKKKMANEKNATKLWDEFILIDSWLQLFYRTNKHDWLNASASSIIFQTKLFLSHDTKNTTDGTVERTEKKPEKEKLQYLFGK